MAPADLIRAADPTRDRLLNAAGEIFAQRGFAATTVREICGKIGANLAAVNYHFRDKQGLYIEAVKAAHCTPPDEQVAFPPGMPADQRLYLFVLGMLTHLLDDRRPAWHAQLMMRELAEPTSACAALVEDYIRPKALVLESILHDVLPCHEQRDEFYLFGFSVVAQCLFYKVQRPIAELLVGSEHYATYSVERLTRHITQFSCQAMGIPITSDWRELRLPERPGRGANTEPNSADPESTTSSKTGQLPSLPA